MIRFTAGAVVGAVVTVGYCLYQFRKMTGESLDQFDQLLDGVGAP